MTSLSYKARPRRRDVFVATLSAALAGVSALSAPMSAQAHQDTVSARSETAPVDAAGSNARRFRAPTGTYDRPFSAVTHDGQDTAYFSVRVHVSSVAPTVQVQVTSGGLTRTTSARPNRAGVLTVGVDVPAVNWQPNPTVRVRARGSGRASSVWTTLPERRDPTAQTAAGPLVLALDLSKESGTPNHILANPLNGKELVAIAWQDTALPGTNYAALTNADIWLTPNRTVALVGQNPVDHTRAIVRRNTDGTVSVLATLPTPVRNTCGPWSALVGDWIAAGDTFTPAGPCVGWTAVEVPNDLITWANTTTGETRTGHLPGLRPGGQQMPQAQTCSAQPCLILADPSSHYAADGINADGQTLPFPGTTSAAQQGPCPSIRVCTQSPSAGYSWVEQQGLSTLVHVARPDGSNATWQLPAEVTCPAGSPIWAAVGTWLGDIALREVVYCGNGSQTQTWIMNTRTGRTTWADNGPPNGSHFYPIPAWFSDNWAN